jgi:hypothetical protein
LNIFLVCDGRSGEVDSEVAGALEPIPMFLFGVVAEGVAAFATTDLAEAEGIILVSTEGELGI